MILNITHFDTTINMSIAEEILNRASKSLSMPHSCFKSLVSANYC